MLGMTAFLPGGGASRSLTLPSDLHHIPVTHLLSSTPSSVRRLSLAAQITVIRSIVSVAFSLENSDTCVCFLSVRKTKTAVIRTELQKLRFGKSGTKNVSQLDSAANSDLYLFHLLWIHLERFLWPASSSWCFFRRRSTTSVVLTLANSSRIQQTAGATSESL